MKTAYDVAVVGAGTAGIFFARKMAEQGYSVAVFDKLPEAEQGKRLGVFHTDQERFAPYGAPEPRPGDEDYVSRFDWGITKSAFDHYPKHTDYPFLVLRFAPFLKRCRAWAAEVGVEFYFDAAFRDFTYDAEGRISGAALDIAGEPAGSPEPVEIASRLVADCSGIPSVARRKLRGSRVETFEITPRDMFYVILHYVKLKYPGRPFPENVPVREQYPEGRIDYPTGYAQYKAWFGSTEDPDGFLFGTGANLSFDYAMKMHEEFRAVVKAPEYEEYEGYGEKGRWERGVTPYHRPPYSMVESGFICLGDAACMTKPFSGEGIKSGWAGCDLAAKVAGKAMQNGAYPTEEALWDYNVRYHTGQGADFANILATLVNAVDSSAKENEYYFKKGIVFSGKQLTHTNRHWNVDMSVGDSLEIVGKVLGGIVTGNVSVASVMHLLKGILCGTQLKGLYRKFPKSPAGFAAWAKKADALWEKTGNMADVVEKVEARKAAKG